MARPRRNAPLMEELLQSRGDLSLEAWRDTLPLRDLNANKILTLVFEKPGLSAKQIGEYLSGRGRGGEAAARRALAYLVQHGYLDAKHSFGLDQRGNRVRALIYVSRGKGEEAAMLLPQITAEKEALGSIQRWEALSPDEQADKFYASMGRRPRRGPAQPRSRTVVSPHAAKRPPCRLCAQDHSLHAHHSHSVDGDRRLVDMTGHPFRERSEAELEMSVAAPDTSFDFRDNPQPAIGPHLACQRGAHDFARGTGLCQRRGCTSQREDAGQRTIFGVDPTLEAERVARERQGKGQRSMFNPRKVRYGIHR